MILSILLGPHAAFLTMASVLTVQALFFADGGLLALGCNIFNLAFLPCFVAYPLIYRTIVGAHPSEQRVRVASIIAAVVGLQLGALAVVLATFFSGVSELPFTTFLLLMLPIHLAIGMVEGLLTAAVATCVGKARPGVLATSAAPPLAPQPGSSRLLARWLLLAAITGGLLSWFASTRLDGELRLLRPLRIGMTDVAFLIGCTTALLGLRFADQAPALGHAIGGLLSW